MKDKSRMQPKCLDCGTPIVDFEWYTHDKVRKGLICEKCGPGRPKMATPKKREKASLRR